MDYGYARVSTRDQNEERQVIALEQYVKDKKHIFIDKQSGKDFNRENYKKLCRRLKPGDAMIVKSIDRLGRNYDEILDEWRKITKEKGCDIIVIDMPLLDTRINKDLTGTLISDIVLQLLSYVAETEREFIRQRQAEGIAIAKENGIKFGRPKKVRPADYETLQTEWIAGKISARKAAKKLGISHNTFLRWTREDHMV